MGEIYTHSGIWLPHSARGALATGRSTIGTVPALTGRGRSAYFSIILSRSRSSGRQLFQLLRLSLRSFQDVHFPRLFEALQLIFYQQVQGLSP